MSVRVDRTCIHIYLRSTTHRHVFTVWMWWIERQRGERAVMNSLLFICTHNRCRSILSEAIANHMAKQRASKMIALSAGSQPVGEVHPLSIKYLKTRGISTEGLQSQSWNEFEEVVPRYHTRCMISIILGPRQLANNESNDGVTSQLICGSYPRSIVTLTATSMFFRIHVYVRVYPGWRLRCAIKRQRRYIIGGFLRWRVCGGFVWMFVCICDCLCVT